MKVVQLDRAYWPRGGWGHYCPACRSGHEIDTEAPNASGAVWNFDGNVECPTFAPSINMRINTPDMKGYQRGVSSTVCHYFITKGQIIYQGDCTHSMKGRTIDLPEIPPQLYFTSRKLAGE